MKTWALLIVLVLSSVHPTAQTLGAADGPWFGQPLPPKFESEPAVRTGDHGLRPVGTIAGVRRTPELQSAAIRKDLETIVDFSKASRATKEIGAGQIWGRVSGFQSSARTVEWAAGQLRQAGIGDVKVQSIPSTMQSGDTGGFADIKAAKITLMQAPQLYHTSGETLDVISTPGLERMARFLAYFVGEAAAKVPMERINPPSSVERPAGSD